MICIVKLKDNDVTGWILAKDIKDAIEKAENALQNGIAKELLEFYNSNKPRTSKVTLAKRYNYTNRLDTYINFVQQ